METNLESISNEAEQYAEKIENLIPQLKYQPDSPERDLKLKRLKVLSNHYHRLTGKYYVVKAYRDE